MKILNFVSQSLRSWYSAVNRCLHLTFVNILDQKRLGKQVTCGYIEYKVFTSYESCFYSSYEGNSSICDLTLYNWMQVFWSMRIIYPDSAGGVSLRRFIDITLDCGDTSPVVKHPPYHTTVRAYFHTYWQLIRSFRQIDDNKRGVPHLDEGKAQKFTAWIMDEIAKSQGWNIDKIGWYGYYYDGPNNDSSIYFSDEKHYRRNKAHKGYIRIEILLTDLSEITVAGKSKIAPPLNLTATVDKLAGIFAQGMRFNYVAHDGTCYPIVTSYLGKCRNMACRDTEKMATCEGENCQLEDDADFLKYNDNTEVSVTLDTGGEPANNAANTLVHPWSFALLVLFNAAVKNV